MSKDRAREVPDDDNEWEELIPTRFKKVCRGADWEPIIHPDRRDNA